MEGAPSVWCLGKRPGCSTHAPMPQKKGKCGEGNSVSEKDIGCSDLPVFFRCEVGPSPRVGSCSQWSRVLSIVELICRLW